MAQYGKLRTIVEKLLKRILRRYRGYRILELPQLNVVFERTKKEPRINLVLPNAQNEFLFGGAETAFRFFDAMRPYYTRSRIIFLDGNDLDHDSVRCPGRDLESRSPQSAHTVAYLKQRDFRATIENENDQFIATHWLTANYVSLIRDAQQKHFSLAAKPFIYLIQDFEPGFYPWSSRYLLADATYAAPDATIAVFNTQVLKDYFEKAGHSFPESYAFEPRLNPALVTYKERLPNHSKRRLLLVYGRPENSRNAFELIVEALVIFAEQYEQANTWELLSLGEQHTNILLPKGLVLKAEGKVALDRYAQHLLDASVGLSLMVSPHPSYPPLEMAEFGVRVVTNSFANKDLSLRTNNIVSLADARPSTVADALMQACSEFGSGKIIPDKRPAFLGSENEFPFSKNLAQRLLG